MNHKDFSLHSGERQTGRSLPDIRRDHIVRYDLAVHLIRERTQRKCCSCLDVFCGNGYGTFMLSQSFPDICVIGVDGSKEAIDMANECYSRPNNMFSWKLFPFSIPEMSHDLIMCFESLEHVEDDRLLLDLILRSLKKDGIALISVPNQDEHPLEKNPHQFHFRHYSHSDFINMVPVQFYIDTWYGQNTYEFTPDGVNTFRLLPEAEMCLREQIAGQVNVYVIRRRNEE
jgi:SAM-dependent methyltransferase